MASPAEATGYSSINMDQQLEAAGQSSRLSQLRQAMRSVGVLPGGRAPERQSQNKTRSDVELNTAFYFDKNYLSLDALHFIKETTPSMVRWDKYPFSISQSMDISRYALLEAQDAVIENKTHWDQWAPHMQKDYDPQDAMFHLIDRPAEQRRGTPDHIGTIAEIRGRHYLLTTRFTGETEGNPGKVKLKDLPVPEQVNLLEFHEAVCEAIINDPKIHEKAPGFFDQFEGGIVGVAQDMLPSIRELKQDILHPRIETKSAQSSKDNKVVWGASASQGKYNKVGKAAAAGVLIGFGASLAFGGRVDVGGHAAAAQDPDRTPPRPPTSQNDQQEDSWMMALGYIPAGIELSTQEVIQLEHDVHTKDADGGLIPALLNGNQVGYIHPDGYFIGPQTPEEADALWMMIDEAWADAEAEAESSTPTDIHAPTILGKSVNQGTLAETGQAIRAIDGVLNPNLNRLISFRKDQLNKLWETTRRENSGAGFERGGSEQNEVAAVFQPTFSNAQEAQVSANEIVQVYIDNLLEQLGITSNDLRASVETIPTLDGSDRFVPAIYVANPNGLDLPQIPNLPPTHFNEGSFIGIGQIGDVATIVGLNDPDGSGGINNVIVFMSITQKSGQTIAVPIRVDTNQQTGEQSVIQLMPQSDGSFKEEQIISGIRVQNRLVYIGDYIVHADADGQIELTSLENPPPPAGGVETLFGSAEFTALPDLQSIVDYYGAHPELQSQGTSVAETIDTWREKDPLNRDRVVAKLLIADGVIYYFYSEGESVSNDDVSVVYEPESERMNLVAHEYIKFLPEGGTNTLRIDPDLPCVTDTGEHHPDGWDGDVQGDIGNWLRDWDDVLLAFSMTLAPNVNTDLSDEGKIDAVHQAIVNKFDTQGVSGFEDLRNKRKQLKEAINAGIVVRDTANETDPTQPRWVVAEGAQVTASFRGFVENMPRLIWDAIDGRWEQFSPTGNRVIEVVRAESTEGMLGTRQGNEPFSLALSQENGNLNLIVFVSPDFQGDLNNIDGNGHGLMYFITTRFWTMVSPGVAHSGTKWSVDDADIGDTTLGKMTKDAYGVDTAIRFETPEEVSLQE